MDKTNEKFIIGSQLEMSTQVQPTMDNTNILQTTIGILYTPPVYLDEYTNKDKGEDTKENLILLKAV